MFDALCDLLHSWRPQYGGAGRSAGGRRPARRPPRRPLALNEMMSVLSLLQPPVPQAVHEAMANAEASLAQLMKREMLQSAGRIGVSPDQVNMSTEHEDAVDLVGMLFDVLFDERDFEAQARTLISRLVVPYVKAAVMDRRLFQYKTHPARRLLNSLSEAVEGNKGEGPQEKRAAAQGRGNRRPPGRRVQRRHRDLRDARAGAALLPRAAQPPHRAGRAPRDRVAARPGAPGAGAHAGGRRAEPPDRGPRAAVRAQRFPVAQLVAPPVHDRAARRSRQRRLECRARRRRQPARPAAARRPAELATRTPRCRTCASRSRACSPVPASPAKSASETIRSMAASIESVKLQPAGARSNRPRSSAAAANEAQARRCPSSPTRNASTTTKTT